MPGLVIVGGSYAALNIAAAARQAGYAEPIRIVTEERWLPYHRPPLSKAFLLGKVSLDSLPLRAESYYRDNAIDVETGTRVERLDLAHGIAETGAGRLSFDRLAIATGTRARLLPVPGADLEGVLSLRSLDDTLGIQGRVAAAGAVVIIGGGFIGLELAATFLSLGKQVTILEGLPRVLARVTLPVLSDFIAGEHTRHGAKLVYDARVEAVEGEAGRVRAVRTADGVRHEADLVIVAIGAVPNTEFLVEHGLAGPNGVEVDEFGRTKDPRIVAAGDCALHPNSFAGETLRLESVQNATDQAKSAGAAIAGVEHPYTAIPWFWSDQYDIKLQMVGLSRGADREVVRGSVEARRFSVFNFRGEKLIGIDSVNAASDHMTGRRLFAKPFSLTPEQAADPSFDLRALL